MKLFDKEGEALSNLWEMPETNSLLEKMGKERKAAVIYPAFPE